MTAAILELKNYELMNNVVYKPSLSRVFPSQAKSFLAGSSKDKNTMSGANAAIAGVAAAVAALAIVGGIFLSKDKGEGKHKYHVPVLHVLAHISYETICHPWLRLSVQCPKLLRWYLQA